MVKYVARTTAPSVTNKNYIQVSKGGYNECILISGNSCLPNCVGYAWGRWRELLGKTPKLSKANAENWYGNTADGYKRGSTPKLGAVICWRKGKAGVSSDGAGHVAVVEKINYNLDGSIQSIMTSNSAYGGSRYYNKLLTPPYSMGGSYTFQGFIYSPIDYEDNKPPKKIDIEYQTYDNQQKKWLPFVKNLEDYAGYKNHTVGGIRAKLSSGTITVKSHIVGGKWLGDITKCDNTSNGYSGIKGKNIDCVCIKTNTGKTVKYRVRIAATQKWLSWVTGFNTNDALNGYAGIMGKAIDAIQIKVG